MIDVASFFIGFVIGAIAYVGFAWRTRLVGALSFVSARRLSKHDVEMTVRHRRREVVYRGSVTVWHRVPDGQRASIEVESFLADRWRAFRWKEEGEENGSRT